MLKKGSVEDKVVLNDKVLEIFLMVDLRFVTAHKAGPRPLKKQYRRVVKATTFVLQSHFYENLSDDSGYLAIIEIYHKYRGRKTMKAKPGSVKMEAVTVFNRLISTPRFYLSFGVL